jgi:hypothetical protein
MLPETQSKRTFVFRKYYEKYKHLWILLYFFVYMAWFNYVEKTVTTHFHVIHVPIDDYIPFCEYFVIPYLLWFPFVGWGIAYMALHNKTDYYKLCAFLFTGMTIFLIISTVYPNGQYLRPTYFTHHNLCTMLCERQYAGKFDLLIVPYESADGIAYAREIIAQASNLPDGANIGIFIGPEGGFAKEEIDVAKEAGAKIITLGNRILRTETAGLAVLSILMFQMEQ